MSLRAFLLAAMLASVASAPARAESDTFVFSLAGIPLGTVTLVAELGDGTYRGGSRISPNGLVGAFADYAFVGRAEGAIDAAGRLSPLRFNADSTSPRATRRTEIEWEDGTPVRVSVEPPRRSAPDPKTAAGALDPVSAGVALLRDNTLDKICDTGVQIFDGSRRSRLAVDKPVAGTEGRVVCTGLYARIEGEAHSLSNQETYPFTLTFAPKGDGIFELERIETRTRFGPAVIARRG